MRPGSAPTLRLASDADVNGDIIRGLYRRHHEIDLVRSVDILPKDASAPDVLAWSTQVNRVLITNDRNTMLGLIWQRIAAGDKLPGVIVTTNQQSIGSAIDDILLVAECTSEDEIRDQVVVYLPLRD